MRENHDDIVPTNGMPEERDTDVDVPVTVLTRVRFNAHSTAESVSKGEMPFQAGHGVLLFGAHSTLAEEQLSRLQVKAVAFRRSLPVDANASGLAEMPPPDLRIAWVRSRDMGQRILRPSYDQFRIVGIAAGEYAQDSAGETLYQTSLCSVVALGIDGRIFRVSLAPGDTAGMTAVRMADRLDVFYQLEAGVQTNEAASYRVTGQKNPPLRD